MKFWSLLSTSLMIMTMSLRFHFYSDLFVCYFHQFLIFCYQLWKQFKSLSQRWRKEPENKQRIIFICVRYNGGRLARLSLYYTFALQNSSLLGSITNISVIRKGHLARLDVSDVLQKVLIMPLNFFSSFTTNRPGYIVPTIRSISVVNSQGSFEGFVLLRSPSASCSAGGHWAWCHIVIRMLRTWFSFGEWRIA